MANRVVAGFAVVLMCLALGTGCGVKSPPLPRDDMSPRTVEDLTADPTGKGVEVTFTIPQAQSASQSITEVRLYHGVLPITGDPDCPPCPPRLREFHSFDLTAASAADLMDGGRFRYLDRTAPEGKQSVYQVQLVDRSGRVGKRSVPIRAVRLALAAAPTGLKAEAAEGKVTLSWDEVKILAGGGAVDDVAGYVVYRKGPEGEKKLNERPLKEPGLVDKTVQNGLAYSYKVHAVRSVEKYLAQGAGSAWVEASPQDQTPPAPPTSLAGAGQPDGMYLRFAPSPDQDVAGYLIERRTGPGGKWTQITEAVVTENVFVDGNVKSGTVYIYRVLAVDAAGNRSDYSDTLEIQHIP